MTSTTAIGIDIGGTGIKGGVVDLESGELISDRIKLPTPKGGEPDEVIEVTREVLDTLTGGDPKDPVGVCFPAIVKGGRTLSAANVSKKWIGLEAEKKFEKALERDIHFVNDADAAGYAETTFGAAKGIDGLVLLTTLGTGIGSALIYNGVLVPNAELGHLEIDGHDAESKAAYSAKEREDLDWAHWAKRLNRYYGWLEFLFTPDLFVIGGGVSKNWDEFAHYLDLKTKAVPATYRNNAGILGAAALAANDPRTDRR
ncbi:polyphosphate--glucose phosphotransferase [Humibacter sp. RRB41]|uniref:polyphosphate--glucose phosphotransferase n=1 Tax=Humibacter sp. RRB41 TaxID=2919946 RepID=UPI001FA9C292|nr:ROK family protein [Humibacter sp. RRB41]